MMTLREFVCVSWACFAFAFSLTSPIPMPRFFSILAVCLFATNKKFSLHASSLKVGCTGLVLLFLFLILFAWCSGVVLRSVFFFFFFFEMISQIWTMMASVHYDRN